MQEWHKQLSNVCRDRSRAAAKCSLRLRPVLRGCGGRHCSAPCGAGGREGFRVPGLVGGQRGPCSSPGAGQCPGLGQQHAHPAAGAVGAGPPLLHREPFCTCLCPPLHLPALMTQRDHQPVSVTDASSVQLPLRSCPQGTDQTVACLHAAISSHMMFGCLHMHSRLRFPWQHDEPQA